MGYITIILGERIFGSHRLVCTNIRLVCTNICLVGRVGAKRIAGHEDLVPNYLTLTKIVCLAIIWRGEANLLYPWDTLCISSRDTSEELQLSEPFVQ